MKGAAWAAGLGLAALAMLAACSGRSGYTPLSNDPGGDDDDEPRVVRDASVTDAHAGDADAANVADSAPVDTQDAEVEAAAPAPVDDAGDGVPP